MVTRDRWKQIDEIFHGALTQPSGERRAYVARACGDNMDLRTEIESLLAKDDETASGLESVVSSDLRRMAQDSHAAEIGHRVGPYRLVRELDSGGMGVV